MNNDAPKHLCKCGKRLKYHEGLSIHAKECQQIAKQELKVVYADRPQCSEIQEEIELSLQPISIHNFMSNIALRHDDSDKNSLCRDNVSNNTMSVIKRALNPIDPINRSLHYFNEDENRLIIQ